MGLGCVCRDHAPWQAKATTFAAVVSSLAQCMAMRYTAYTQNLWRVAAAAFNAVVAAGLPAVNIAYVNQVPRAHLLTLRMLLHHRYRYML